MAPRAGSVVLAVLAVLASLLVACAGNDSTSDRSPIVPDARLATTDGPVDTTPDGGTPDPGGDPDAGESLPVPDAGESLPVPDAGESLPAPDAGESLPAPDAGESLPAPDAGESLPVPDAGESLPVPDAGVTPPPPDASVTPPPPDASVTPPPPDAGLPPDGGQSDPGGDGLPPDPGVRFLTNPPPPACSPEVAASWVPQNGFSGGISGTKTCGPTSPSCPTTYIPGNSGDACSTAADCTGPNPVCLQGGKYASGTCAATGCELGSNFGCQEGAVCLNGGDGQTYCVGGCGIDQSGCFVGCERDGFSCFNTESKSLGTCFAAAGVRQCDPKASATCTQPDFGDGICIQTSWDDQTVGRCFETCDPIAQDCSADRTGCYVLREYKGYPVCFQSWGYPEGTECDRMTECAEGLRCACDVSGQSPCQTGLICRRYCALDGSTPCGEGTFCTPLAPGSRWGSCLPPQP